MNNNIAELMRSLAHEMKHQPITTDVIATFEGLIAVYETKDAVNFRIWFGDDSADAPQFTAFEGSVAQDRALWIQATVGTKKIVLEATLFVTVEVPTDFKEPKDWNHHLATTVESGVGSTKVTEAHVNFKP